MQSDQMQGPFSWDFQLDTKEAGREFHRRNDGREIQRPDIVDDCCRGLLLQARIDRIIHGHELNGTGPATLIIFGFRFHGLDEDRRFKQARIIITFQDEEKQHGNDPEVITLWPNGNFTLGEPLEVEVEESSGGEAGVNVTGGAGIQGGGQVLRRWERKIGFKKSIDKISLTGSIMLDTDIREYGRNNAIRITISESKIASPGIVTDLRAAVLLRRQSLDDTFLGTIKMKADAHFAYNALRGARAIFGGSPHNDPIIFKPGVQYLRPKTLSGVLEDKLAEQVDERNLGGVAIEGLAGVLGSTVLPN
ncbi:hypothetical protein COL26b_007087 [Colletotrichum chrysophilum]|uniref:Uncharacterized protein n=1 Tax=Colletotrichum chrysophilum TaxID=1836956 RepID=A0AAD9A105_9PEZI|nr:uncharacterized protein COL26b_007087 [Colletotrichum chrysophilum]KAJ0374621.1 hypothetical protein COL26b_007087 [Colletotrichum chrysophilum]KAK1839393.1 hypothetical protein CCHR01_17979 [Colletotrichum chrysophilum]